MSHKISSTNKDPLNERNIDISAMSFEDFARYTFGDLEKLEEPTQLDQFDQLVENALDKLVSSQCSGERETDDLVRSKPEGSSPFYGQRFQGIPSQSSEMIQHELKSIVDLLDTFKENMYKIAKGIRDQNLTPALRKALQIALKQIVIQFTNALKETLVGLQKDWLEGLQEPFYPGSHEKRRKATYVLKQLNKKCEIICEIIENRKLVIETIKENDNLDLSKSHRKNFEKKVKKFDEKLQQVLPITGETPSLLNLAGRRQTVEAHHDLQQLVEESTQMRKMLACPGDEEICVLQFILPRQEIYDDIKRLFRAHSTFGDPIGHALDHADEQARSDAEKDVLNDFEEKQKIIQKILNDQIEIANRYFECRNKLQPNSNSK